MTTNKLRETICGLLVAIASLAAANALAQPAPDLVLTNGKNDNVYLSSRNLPGVNVLPFGDESVYDVLWAHTVVIERSALEATSEAPVEADDEEADDA